MELTIISPEKILYKGQAESVTLPGLKGSFTVLERHASIISVLGAGTIRYLHKEKESLVPVNEGFVEVKNNVVTVCIE
ncbi:MAG: ATP synthase F1 subunit epsilon [Dysgonamonadaceae bacterium]|jgi:F-type H+-transporting ATPase subunit epsilon|nr:ATP synthase F1 subunit epsilon [Dysgonamonadaceae bacterium]